MNTPFRSLALLWLSVASVHCGAAVSPTDRDAALTDAADVSVADAAPSPSCEEVRAACGPSPQQLVRAHATGLMGMEGARVQFAMRYLLVDGEGLNAPRGVAMARSEIRDGAFEACVCVPRGANSYPQVAAVVFAPGTTWETGREVVRASFSQRFGTTGDEDLTDSLLPSTPARSEAALAAMVDRTEQMTVRGLEAALAGFPVYAGLVADERPVAAQIAADTITRGQIALRWTMPGRPWPGERLVLVVDRNQDGRCGEGVLGASMPLMGRRDLSGIGEWLQGAALASVCEALALEAPRE
jgi:hypothetical protein